MWNIGGMWDKLGDEEWGEYVRTFDILALQETWIRHKIDVPTIEGVSLIGFRAAVKRVGINRGRNSGGVCVFVKEEMKDNLRIKKESKEIQNLIAVVLKKEKVSVNTIYNQPKELPYADIYFFDKLEQELLESQEKAAIVAGDFNARIGRLQEGVRTRRDSNESDIETEEWVDLKDRRTVDNEINEYGRKMMDMCGSINWRVLSGRAEGSAGEVYSYQGRGQSTIDWVIGNSEANKLMKRINLGMRVESDHAPLEIELNGSAQKQQIKRKRKKKEARRKKFEWREEKEEEVKEGLTENADMLAGLINWAKFDKEADVDAMAGYIELIMKKVFRCMERVIKWKKKSDKLVKTKNAVARALRKARKTGTGESYDEFREAKKNWREEKRKTREESREKEEAEIEEILRTNDWSVIWKKVKLATGDRRSKGEDLIGSKEWERHFDTVFNITGNTKMEWKVERQINVEIEELDRQITVDEVDKALRGMKAKSAPGIDKIPTVFFKKVPEFFSGMLADVFNVCYEQGRFPKRWSEAIIQPIFKNRGSRGDPNNYRGIALLPCIGKVFTKVLKNRLNKWVEERNVLSEFQAGFRRGFTTIDQGFILQTILEKRLRRKMRTIGIFVDLKKAYDSVDRDAMWCKLREIGISCKMLELLRDKYKWSQFAIRGAHGELSDFVPSTGGLIQGDQMSALLFIIFINDLAERLSRAAGMDAITLDGRKIIPCLIYADDLVILSSSNGGMRRMIKELEAYCEEWKLVISVEKTKVVEFSARRKEWPGGWEVNGEKLECVKSFKYLGIIFEKGGGWKEHLEAARRKASLVNYKIGKLVYKWKKASVKLPLHLLDSMSKAIMLYGAELTAFSGNWKGLESEVRKLYKRILGQGRGTAGVGIEYMLGRVEVRDEAVIRALMFWKRLLGMKEDRLVKKAYLYQKGLVEDRVDCWAKRVKEALDKLGLGFMWERQDTLALSKAKFKRIISQWVRDGRVTMQKIEAGKMPSSKDYVGKENILGGLDGELEMLDSLHERRKYVRLMLKSDGGIVRREEDGKWCGECEKIIGVNVFVHRVIYCEKFDKYRQESEYEMEEIKKIPESERFSFVCKNYSVFMNFL